MFRVKPDGTPRAQTSGSFGECMVCEAENCLCLKAIFCLCTYPFLSSWKLLAEQNLPHEILRSIAKATIFIFHYLSYFKSVCSKDVISLTSNFYKIYGSLVQHAGISLIIEFSAMAKS